MVSDMYKKILVATMGEYMDELIEHTLELLHVGKQRSYAYMLLTHLYHS